MCNLILSTNCRTESQRDSKLKGSSVHNSPSFVNPYLAKSYNRDLRLVLDHKPHHRSMKNDVSSKVIVRPVRPEGAAAIAVLSKSLGYPVAEEYLRLRIGQLADCSERLALAAVLEGEVVGWVDVAVERHLQSAAVVVIVGLVVRDDMRRRRIGLALVSFGRGSGLRRSPVRLYGRSATYK